MGLALTQWVYVNGQPLPTIKPSFFPLPPPPPPSSLPSSLAEGHSCTLAKTAMTLQLVLSPEQRRLLTDGVHKAHLRCVCALCGVCVHCVIVVFVCICGVCMHCVLALSKFKYSESVTVNRLSCALPSSDRSNRVTTKTCVYINLNVGMCALCGVGLLCGPPL